MTAKGAETATAKEVAHTEGGSNLFVDLFSPPEDAESPGAYTTFQREIRTFLNGLARENRPAKKDLKTLGSLLHRLPQIATTEAKYTDRPIRIRRLTLEGHEITEEAAKGISFTSSVGERLGELGGENIESVQLDIVIEKGRKKKKGKKKRGDGVQTPYPMIRVSFHGKAKALASLTIRQGQQSKSINAEFRAGFLGDSKLIRSENFPDECAEAFSEIQNTLARRLLFPEEITETVGEGGEELTDKEETVEDGEQSQWAKNLRACETKLEKHVYPEAIPPTLVDTLREELDIEKGGHGNGRVLICYLLDVTPKQLDRPEELVAHLGAGASLVANLPDIVETTLLRRMDEEAGINIQSVIAQNVLNDIREQFRMLKDLGGEEIV